MMIQAEWEGWSGVYHHAFLFGALIFASLRWITVKHIGHKVPTSAMIFWEPSLVLLLMGVMINLDELWHKATLELLSSAVLLFMSRQCLVRSYQATITKASSVSALIYTKLAWALLFSYWIWGNLPTLMEWLGILLIISSSCLIVFGNPKRTKTN